MNQFIYDELKFNSGIEDSAFKAPVPKTMHVSRIPGSCTPPK